MQLKTRPIAIDFDEEEEEEEERDKNEKEKEKKYSLAKRGSLVAGGAGAYHG